MVTTSITIPTTYTHTHTKAHIKHDNVNSSKKNENCLVNSVTTNPKKMLDVKKTHLPILSCNLVSNRLELKSFGATVAKTDTSQILFSCLFLAHISA